MIIHGESDATSTTYEADSSSLRPTTTRISPADRADDDDPAALSQQHSAPTTAGSRSTATLAQWRAGVTRPGEIVCVGPKYQYPYISDATHLTNPGYERLGEKLGQVFAERVVRAATGGRCEPTSRRAQRPRRSP